MTHTAVQPTAECSQPCNTSDYYNTPPPPIISLYRRIFNASDSIKGTWHPIPPSSILVS
ncbi:hypothetical protein B0T26DRAFT_735523 [Lasiosphaeria miniovina]|uniref:Uncharacterized protein n=1 Tax=Lasiosphaeria miniovina TaxID=1954250 RepID=A0AA39ZR13_9PEZI|nr:uncharacterized protein B0T26DRAFT_735523 [Lasiosphaeria miniovina]KAK0701997.1 hypothetical protein B0T26DRAFT_735523 [Lasiosphaeria miniovina]